MKTAIIGMAVFIILTLSSTGSFSCNHCKLDCGKLVLVRACKTVGNDAKALDIVKVKTTHDLLKAAEKAGYKSDWVYVPADKLSSLTSPYIAHLFGDHFVYVQESPIGEVTIWDPATESPAANQAIVSTLESLKSAFTGQVMPIRTAKEALVDIKPTGPAAIFEPYVVDFSNVFQGDDVSRTIEVKNVGSADLVISGMRGTCGCQTSVIGEKTIAPGKSSEINVKLITTGRSGEQNLKFYLDSNSTDQPIAQIDLTGFIRPQYLAIYPSSVHFGTLRASDTVTRQISISDPYGKGLSITDLKCDSLAVKLSMQKAGDADSPEYIITAVIEQNKLTKNLETTMNATSNHPRHKNISIPITAILQTQEALIEKPIAPVSPVLAQPSVYAPEIDVFVTGAVKGKVFRHTLSLKTPADQNFKITKIDCPLKFIAVSSKVVKPKNSKNKETETLIFITFASDAPAGTISTGIMLHTTDPKQPLMRIKVYGIISQPPAS